MANLRSIQLPKDIDAMLSLAQAGFQYPENPAWSIQTDDMAGMVEQIRVIKRVWPAIRFLQFFSPVLRDALHGFIFQDDGKPVGMINFTRQGNDDEWLISSVTVQPTYRRCGIARKLVETTINDLRARKAKAIFLEVISGNLPAFNLYKELGFDPFAVAAQYVYDKNEPISPVALPAGYTLERVTSLEWQVRFELAQRITPANILKFEPVNRERFRPSVFARLSSIAGGSKNLMEAVYTKPDHQIVAFASCSYRIRPAGMNYGEIQLDSAHESLAPYLVKQLLSKVQNLSPGRKIEIHYKEWQPYLIAAAEAVGCTKRYAYHRMGMLLD
ncbi:MAG: GNAT family N-acetyltransferase, partial [Chloroflexota bacterium]